MQRIPMDNGPGNPTPASPVAKVVGRIDLVWCQFCTDRATAILVRRLDGKEIRVCDECRDLARGCPLYWVKEVGWPGKVRPVDPRRG